MTPGTWVATEPYYLSLTLYEDGTGELAHRYGVPEPSTGTTITQPVTWGPGQDESFLGLRVDGDLWWIRPDGLSPDHWGKLWYFPTDEDGMLIELIKVP